MIVKTLVGVCEGTFMREIEIESTLPEILENIVYTRTITIVPDYIPVVRKPKPHHAKKRKTYFGKG